jgi:uncharacterized RDD family membrane protein YckC
VNDREVVVDLSSSDASSGRERRGAALYDLLVVTYALLGVILLLERVWPSVREVPLLVLWATLVLTEGLTGGSPGKLISGLRVTRADGGRIGLVQAAVRRPWALVLPLAFVPGLGRNIATLATVIIWIAMAVTTTLDPVHRGLHDRLAGTRVVPVIVNRPARIAVAASTALLVLLTILLASDLTTAPTVA